MLEADLQTLHRYVRPAVIAVGLGLLLAACETSPVARDSAGTGANKPYVINGIRYLHLPREDPNYDAVGTASWYGPGFHGRTTASGQRYNMNAMTAAHTTLPFGTKVRVTNLENGRSVVLTVNDRGPFSNGRIIDVSRKAAAQLGFHEVGTARVRVQAVRSPGRPRHAETVRPRPGPADVDHVMPILAQAMESQLRLQEFAWQNPESGRGGHITPLTDAGAAQKTGCRNYRRTADEGDRRTVYVGRACRTPDGTWQIAREEKRDS